MPCYCGAAPAMPCGSRDCYFADRVHPAATKEIELTPIATLSLGCLTAASDRLAVLTDTAYSPEYAARLREANGGLIDTTRALRQVIRKGDNLGYELEVGYLSDSLRELAILRAQLEAIGLEQLAEEVGIVRELVRDGRGLLTGVNVFQAVTHVAA